MNRLRLPLFAALFVFGMGVDECEQALDLPGDPDVPEPIDLDGGLNTEDDLGIAGECAPVAQLSCGDVVSGDTGDFNSGSTSTIDGYPVAVGNYSGPEIAWTFLAPASGEVELALLGARPTELNHDLFVLAGDGACESAAATARGFNDVTFEVEQGKRYYLLLDGFDGESGPFEAELRCELGDSDGEVEAPVTDSDAEVVFSPAPLDSSHVADTIAAIDSAQATIDLAMYSFRLSNVMEAIGRAVQRGVTVRAVLESGRTDRTDPAGTKSGQLEDLGVEVRWTNKIMHHKFALVDGPRTDLGAADTATLVTGSANWSWSAATKYDENTVLVRGDEKLVLAFQREFDHVWDNGRPVVWNEDIATIAHAGVAQSAIDAAEGSDAVFTSENMTTFVSSTHGNTFRTTSGSGATREAIAELILGADSSVRIASGHLRSRQITDALLELAETKPHVDVRVYLDSQEYTSASYRAEEGDSYDACVAAASTATQLNNCEDRGLHFGLDLHQAGIPLRYKHYAYRWHYSYAVQMHHKYVVVDDSVVGTGSYNFSNNAEHDTLENFVIYEASRYPSLVAEFVANFDSIWDTGAGAYTALISSIGDGPVPLVYDSMALTWDEVTALKATIYANCPQINDEEFRTNPQAHLTCE